MLLPWVITGLLLAATLFISVLQRFLANRMILRLEEVISSNQGAFIPKRGIVENILLAQEVVCDYHKEKGAPQCTLKINLMKAYDSLDWKYILYCLKCFGAPAKYITWIRACITSPSFTIGLKPLWWGIFQEGRGLDKGILYPLTSLCWLWRGCHYCWKRLQLLLCLITIQSARQ